jgi:formylglycine-generating enzyme
MLVLPMIAASLVVWTSADATPVLGPEPRLAGGTSLSPPARDRNLRLASGEVAHSTRYAKRPPSKSRVHPKRKKRGAVGSTSRQATRREDLLKEATPSAAPVDSLGCPSGMAAVGGPYCIDVYEASLVEVLPNGEERPWPYFEVVPREAVVRAVSLPGVYPQGYISGLKAREACERSGKRLCKPDEWRNACMGPRATVFPYGNALEAGRCNDNGRSGMRFFNPQLDGKPEHRWMWGYGGNMADPRLNQLDGTLTRTGERAGCTNEYGVFDMVGNLHEWVDDPDGTFQGGYYLDTHLNGDGCNYRTTAHPVWHLDYSTGFRCCADASR